MMESEPLVSVVIATYNMGQYLPDAIDSVLDQSWKNLEVVVVDDGSKDDTEEYMKRYTKNERVRYFVTENRGQPKAKNRGIKESRGDFIAFCDADDLWLPDKLKFQIPVFKDPKVGVVYSEVGYIDENNLNIVKSSPARHSGYVTNQLVIQNFVPFGAAVIRRTCVEKNGAFDESLPMGIDWDLWLRYSIEWKFKYIQDTTYIYRIWPGQMSKNYRGRYENAFRILTKFIESNPGAVPPKLKARAWSDMYISRGMNVARGDKTFFEPLKDVLIGLRYDWTYKPAWKSVAKILLRRV